jgi:16S rRNA (guanine966-N2)-methyltransferase
LRIIAGLHRGRALVAPAGQTTRPTADRLRQAVFDMLWHAPWAGRALIEGVQVLDAFAGTGALGLEALSRGAAAASFIEQDRAALAALRQNIAACGETARASVFAADATRPPRARAACDLVFLDPPYGQELAPRALAALRQAGWLAPGALLVIEIGKSETLSLTDFDILAEKQHGAGRVLAAKLTMA